MNNILFKYVKINKGNYQKNKSYLKSSNLIAPTPKKLQKISSLVSKITEKPRLILLQMFERHLMSY